MNDEILKFKDSSEYFETNIRISETEQDIHVYQWVDGSYSNITGYIIKKDEFIMQKILKRLPLETLITTKVRIEQEIEERQSNNEHRN